VSISRDDGKTWRDASEGLPGNALTALRIGENGKVYAEAGPSAFQWDGRSPWRQIGPVATWVANLVTAPWGETFADAGFLGLFRAGPRLTEWRQVLASDGSRRNGKPGSGPALFIATPPGGVIRTRDRGVTWELVLNQNVYGFTVTKSGAILASTQNGIFRSTDQGEVWTERSIGLTTFWVHAMTSGPDGTIYAGTRTGEVYRSTDVGDRWRTMGATTGGGHNPVHALIVSRMGTLLAGTYSGMFRWYPQERRWSRLPLGVDQRKQSVAAIVQNATGVLFAATKGGMFTSSDDGMTWLSANDGLGSEEVLSLAVDGTDHVLAGTTAGVFTTASK
jgi:ligand-binding sensor domain-containing protein